MEKVSVSGLMVSAGGISNRLGVDFGKHPIPDLQTFAEGGGLFDAVHRGGEYPHTESL